MIGLNQTKRGRTIPLDERDRARQLAADLVAGDFVKDEEIARRCGISRRTLGYWKHDPPFVAEVNRIRREYRDSLTIRF